MEHRCGMRRANDAQVLLDRSPMGVRRGRFRDLSLSGAFVRVSPLGLKPNARVTLVVRCAAGSQCVSATVVRTAHDGVGLTFDDEGPQALRGLFDQPEPVSADVAQGNAKQPLVTLLSLLHEREPRQALQTRPLLHRRGGREIKTTSARSKG